MEEFDLKNKKILIIDDMQAARTALRAIAQQAGGFHIETASSYSDAIARIRAGGSPEVVLCDYNLGKGRDGQQLYEELCHFGLVGESTIWIMVTAESKYSRVMAVADLAPDDYILKPFTAAVLKERLERVASKKGFLGRFYKLRQAGRTKLALAELERLKENKNAQHLAQEVLRNRVELLVETGETESAEEILRQHSREDLPPWGQAALARCAIARKAYIEARKILQALTEEHPNFLAALDLKAEIHSALGEYEEAQQTLERVIEKNPLNWRRQQRLSHVAVENGNYEQARHAAEKFHRHAVTPDAIKPEDHLHLVRIHHATGDKAAAQAVMSKVADKLSPEQQIVSFALATIANPDDSAAFVQARPAICKKERPTEEFGVDVARAALAIGDIELAELMAERLLGNRETMRCFHRLWTIFTAAGKESSLREAQLRAAWMLIGAHHETNPADRFSETSCRKKES